jgi:hypothetical protein
MIKHMRSALLVFCSLLVVNQVATAAESPVPAPFRGFDDSSKYEISYDDLTTMLKTVVVDVGRSNRKIARATQAATGTRMKSSVKRSSASEGNRFYFETFKDNEEARQLLNNIKTSLEQLPAEVPLEYFSRDEQLAYWLNLYNVTLLNEVVDVFPKSNLKKVLVGKKSILSKKLLEVSGIPLSLNDIEFTILKHNYDNNPLIMYGLYQGIIGGPNIRRSAYKGNDVWRALSNNAIEFVNSNRGTYSNDKNGIVLRVSSLYDRNSAFFPDFNSDLSVHLMEYVEGWERTMLAKATKIKPDINDWTITSLEGRHRDLAGSFANNNAALLDSVKSTSPADGGGVMGAAAGYGSAALASKGKPMSRISPELAEHLFELNESRMRTNTINSTVTLEEMGEFPVQPQADTDDKPEKKDQR